MTTLIQKDTVIVGGGMAGLTAAILLAQAGQSVAVYEKSNAWGGRAMTRKRGGFHFNLGPRAVYRGFSAEKILTSLGTTLSGKPPIINRYALAQRDGKLYKLAATPSTMLTSRLLTAGDKVAYARALLKVQRAKVEKSSAESWQDWATREVPNLRARQALTALARVGTYANAPTHIQASVVLRQLKAVLGDGVLYLDRGWQQIVDALVEKALAAGVELNLGQGIKQVDPSSAGHLVTLRDGAISAENLILAVDPAAAKTLLPHSPTLARAVEQQLPVKAACLTLGLRDLPTPTITFAMGIDRPLYYSLHTAAAQLAAKGEHVVHLAYYRAPTEVEDSAEIRSELEAFMQQLQPAWRDYLIAEEFLPNITVYHALPQVSTPRPSITVEDVPNCYVIGDWVNVDEILLDAAVASAKIAAQAINASSNARHNGERRSCTSLAIHNS